MNMKSITESRRELEHLFTWIRREGIAFAAGTVLAETLNVIAIVCERFVDGFKKHID